VSRKLTLHRRFLGLPLGGALPIMTASRLTLHRLVLGSALLLGLTWLTPAPAQYIGREQDIVGLRLGQRVLVDDGTCGAGQVKEVSGSKMTAVGVTPARKCIPRFGPKKK
jgi:hypothetical protein